MKTRPKFDSRVPTKDWERTPFIVFDLETTGGNPSQNGITEICALRWLGGKIVGRFYSLVNPQRPIPPIVRRMTGINNRMLKDAPTIDQVMPKFLRFIGRDVLVSHNIQSDIGFLKYFAEKTAHHELDNYYLCTHLLVSRLLPETPKKSLKGLAQHFNFDAANHHRAEADAKITLELFHRLIPLLKQQGIEAVDDAIRLQGDAESILRLGWKVSPRFIQKLPNRPGVFYLRDEKNKLLFFSSATALRREVEQLGNFSQVARKLARVITHAKEVQFETTANEMEAYLRECEIAIQNKPQILPWQWHNRIVSCFWLKRTNGQIILHAGPLEEGAIYAFAPLYNVKQAQHVLSRLAEILKSKPQKNKLIFRADFLPLIVAWFKGELAAFLLQIKKQQQSWLIKWRSEKQTCLQQLCDVAEQLLAMQDLRLDPLYSLFDQWGNLCVQNGHAMSWIIYPVCAGRLGPPWMHEGHIENIPRNKKKGSWWPRRNASEITFADCYLAQAALWGIYGPMRQRHFIASNGMTNHSTLRFSVKTPS